MKNTYILFLLIVIISGCGRCKGGNSRKGGVANDEKDISATINHFNVTIAPDLSNRLNAKFYPKAVSDTSIVNLILDNIYPKVLKHKRSMNQLDQFRIDFINKKQINAYSVNTNSLGVDFKRFGNRQRERITYLKDNFATDVEVFKTEYKRINEKAVLQPYGSDIWTYLNEGITRDVVDTAKSYSSFDGNHFLNQQKNILVLLTDGYIESGIYGQGYDLSGKNVKAFRDAFKKSGEHDINKFYNEHPGFKITPLNNPLLRDLNILVLEMYDRSESNQGATVHPTDMQIMKIFWTDWLKRSGVKEVELHSKFSNKAEAEKVIMRFIGV